MSLDKAVFEKIVTGLNELEGDKCKSFTISGLDIPEASELEERYLSNYQLRIINSYNINDKYVLMVSKKKKSDS